MEMKLVSTRSKPFHNRMRVISSACATVALFSLLIAGGCATTHTQSTASTTPASLEPVELHQTGHVILAGQVTPTQLHELQSKGVQAVINCRTQSELDRLPFDESELVDDLGITFVHVPLGGDDGYSPADVDAFAQVLQSHDGDVLVHCSRGGRVRTLYAAYLVRYQGYSADDARTLVQSLGQSGPTSFERLLGERIRYELTGEPLPPQETESSS